MESKMPTSIGSIWLLQSNSYKDICSVLLKTADIILLIANKSEGDEIRFHPILDGLLCHIIRPSVVVLKYLGENKGWLLRPFTSYPCVLIWAI